MWVILLVTGRVLSSEVEILKSVFHFTAVTSIRCYQCSSADDPENEDNCGAYEDFDREEHIAVECNTDESKAPGTFCMKITQQGPRGFICKLISWLVHIFSPVA